MRLDFELTILRVQKLIYACRCPVLGHLQAYSINYYELQWKGI